jgi:hypothetical protein
MSRTVRRCLFLLLLPCAGCAAAQSPSVTLEVTATDPEPQSSLQRSETFYVRVAYSSDRPLRIRIRGRAQGRDVPTMTNPSPRSEPPSGEALVWLSSDHAVALDEIQVRAEDQTDGKVVAQASIPVKLKWSETPAEKLREPADWAGAMSRAQQQRVSEDMRRYSEGGGGLSSVLLTLVITLSLPVYIAAQVWSLKRLEGGWRKAALIPLVVMGVALCVSLLALAAGSNLWPIWLILLAPLALLWLLILLLMHRAQVPA